jgi:hypothetical protein
VPDVVPLLYGDGVGSFETSKLDRRNDLRFREGVLGDVGWEAVILLEGGLNNEQRVAGADGRGTCVSIP